jgi:hypothetical protein
VRGYPSPIIVLEGIYFMTDNWEFPKNLQVGDKVEFELSDRIHIENGTLAYPRWNFNEDYGATGKYAIGTITDVGEDGNVEVLIYPNKSDWTWRWPPYKDSRPGSLRKYIEEVIVRVTKEHESTYLELL